MEEANQEILRKGLSELGLELDDGRIAKLIGYHDLLMQRNLEFNLTGAKEERESLIKNLLNALGPWRQVHPTKFTIDVGSGGGLPGLPLAIALDMKHMALCDSKQKKCRFLEEAAKAFAPAGTRVICADTNTIRERFQQVVTCGFGTLDKILKVTRNCLASSARILAYKGTRERITEEIEACPKSEREWEIIPFKVPFLEEGTQRHLCVFKRGG